ncbi:Myb/SANT-like domain [Macleaya cordata]|uniref:Myb/SANT-like domain n=1 Tax=Macleaya cordata TaxID=56857 RepID=A0A200R738_MACCD|nr:Myb/SANT-like domain [Macleaya cordata]
MDNETPLSIDRGRTKWTPPMDRCFIDIMLEQVHDGNKIHNSFRKKAWVEMVASFNEKSGLQLDKEVLRNRSKKLRMQYSAVKVLLDHDGFHWDDTRKMVTADSDVWDNYLKAHPEAQTFKTKTIPNYNDLCVIYGNETVNGRYNALSHNLSLIDNIPKMETNGVSEGLHSPNMSMFDEDHSVVRYQLEGIDNITPISSDRSRTNWTPTMDRYFIGIMVDQVRRGNKNGNVFRKKAWKQMVVLFNTKFRLQLDKEVLRNRAKKLRIQYIAMKMLLDKTGFHWDDTRQMVTADDSVWDDYLKAHPEARSYRTKTLPNYNDLCVIYGGEPANGRPNHSDHNMNLDNENPEVKNDGVSGSSHSPATSSTHEDFCVASQGVGLDNQAPLSIDRSKTNWTPPMDNYLIDIMIDHVHKGYKIGKTFHREAWMYMLELFNTKFGLQLDKEVLKNRYKKLRTQYNAMSTLLSNSGFRWDETRQLVTADDSVWDDYLKEHPEARSYRTKTVPNYNSLCVIYGNSIGDGRYNNSGHDQNLKSVPIGVFGTPQSPLISASHEDLAIEDMQEESSQSGGSMDIFNGGSNKRPYETPSTSQHSRKSMRSSGNSMLDALREMAVAVTMLANKKKENDTTSPLENVVNALNATPDLDEDLYLDACDLLEDEQKAKMFLALDVTIRKKWLMRKLRPE